MKNTQLLRRASSAPSLSALLGIAVYSTLRWYLAAKQQISRWVVVGGKYVNPKHTPPYLHVFLGPNGYDGQYFWRIAVKPWSLKTSALDGIRLSSAYRLNRIVYPTLSWLVAGGRASLIAWSLVIVNVLALLVLVQCALAIAEKAGKSSWAGLSILLIPGLVGAYSRDLSEILTVTFLLLGLLAAREQRWVWSGVALAFGILTRESLLLPILVFGLCHIYVGWREHHLFGRRNFVWILPAFAVIIWQLVLYHSLHEFPLFIAGGQNLGAPLVGLLSSIGGWFSIHTVHRLGEAFVISLQLLAFISLCFIAWRSRNKNNFPETAVFLVSVAMVLCETKQGWKWPFDLRYGVNAMALGWLFILQSSATRHLRTALVLVGPAVLATLLLRIVAI
jgi:hypothetical protein